MLDHAEPHVATVRSYVTVFLILVALTLLTVFTALSPLGVWHTPVAMGIAAAKATLVFLFFMHLLHSPTLIWLVAGGTFLWLAIMFVLTLSDYWTRGMVGPFQ
jgi:cytochrome c oxidase subunit 4